MKLQYNPPSWLIVIETVVSMVLIVIAAVTMSTQPCSVSEFPFSAKVWLLITGVVGLFYALYVFIFMVVAFCVCFICCLAPVMILALLVKILFFISWAIVGIVMLSLGHSLATDCTLVFAFMIVGIIFLLLDIYPSYKYTKIEES